MASISEKTFDFRDRGRQVVDWFDLFDECKYGADNLFFRGRFETDSEVAEQIAASLDSKYKDMGAGNPVRVDNDGEYAEGNSLHRYNVPCQEHWTPPDPKDPYPYKARYAVRFLLRLHFYNDYGYIEVGVPWEKLRNEDGSINENYPIEQKYVDSGFTLGDIRPLRWWGMSKYDVNVVMGGMSFTDEEGNKQQAQPTEDYNILPDDIRELIETVDFIEDNKSNNADILIGFVTQDDEDNIIVTQRENAEVDP